MNLMGIISWPIRRKPTNTSHSANQGASKTIRFNPHPVPVKNFRPGSIAVNENIDRMVRAAQSFSELELRQDPGEHIEEIHSCTIDPAMHLVQHSQTFDSILLYIEDGISTNKKMFEAADQLARIVRGLATHVFQVPLETTCLFRDKKSGKELIRRLVRESLR